MGLLRSASTVAVYTLVNRVLGLVRDVLFAHVLGAGMVSDAFLIAYRFPYFFSPLFIEGGFHAAFVPSLTERLLKGGRGAAQAFVAEVVAVVIAGLLPLTVVALITMPWLMRAIAPGFLDEPPKFALAVDLARLTFPYLIFIGLVALLGGALNTLDRYAAAAAMPSVFNLVMIVILGLTQVGILSLPVHALAIGMTLAGAVQLVVLVGVCRANEFDIRMVRPHLSPDVARLLRLLLPALIGTGVLQANVMIDEILASLLPEGSISFLYYSFQLTQLPVGVAGVSVGAVLLPALSRHLQSGNRDAARDSQNRAMEFTLLLTLPAAAALIAIPEPIVRVLFMRGAFDAHAAIATAQAVRAFALGLPAFVLIKVLTPGFYARGDTKTPVKIAALVMVANVVAAALLMQFLVHVGIVLATAATAWLNVALLALVQHRRGFLEFDHDLKRRVPRSAAAAAIMGVAVYFGAALFSESLIGSLWRQAFALGALVAFGALLFAALTVLVRAVTPSEMKGLLRPRAAGERQTRR
jgi:putative peptidoglycan lipid II flippase